MKQSSHIRISLTTPDSLQKGIDALKQYEMELDAKCQLFVKKLGDHGLEVLDANISWIAPEGDIDTKLSFTDNGCTAIITMSGQEVAFIEFGAGVRYNTSVGSSLHPKGKDLGFTIGSYNPNSKRAENPKGWFYTDSDGTKQHTYGTPTYAPLHTSEMEMINVINKIAREVFTG